MTHSVQRGLDPARSDQDLAREAARRQRAKAEGRTTFGDPGSVNLNAVDSSLIVPPPTPNSGRAGSSLGVPDDTIIEAEPLPDWRWPEPQPGAGDVYLRIELPWAVVVPDNAKHGVLNGRILNTKRYRTAKDKAHEIALATCRGQRFGEGCVRVELHVWPPDRRRRDIANTLKLICDSLSGAAYADDEQIVEQRIRREAVSRDNPRVVVMVSASPCP